MFWFDQKEKELKKRKEKGNIPFRNSIRFFSCFAVLRLLGPFDVSIIMRWSNDKKLFTPIGAEFFGRGWLFLQKYDHAIHKRKSTDLAPMLRLRQPKVNICKWSPSNWIEITGPSPQIHLISYVVKWLFDLFQSFIPFFSHSLSNSFSQQNTFLKHFSHGSRFIWTLSCILAFNFDIVIV